jgi:hypothetical protein
LATALDITGVLELETDAPLDRDALNKVTGILRIFRNLRCRDQLYRFGGEEFVIVMPCGSEPEAAAILERLRHKTEGWTPCKEQAAPDLAPCATESRRRPVKHRAPRSQNV